jgi:hypothetical protein
MFPAQAGTQTLTHRPESIIWIPAFAGNTDERVFGKQGPHPTLSLRERAFLVLALAPLGERVG